MLTLEFKVLELKGNSPIVAASFDTEGEAIDYLNVRWFDSEACKEAMDGEAGYESAQQNFYSYFSIEKA